MLQHIGLLGALSGVIGILLTTTGVFCLTAGVSRQRFRVLLLAAAVPLVVGIMGALLANQSVDRIVARDHSLSPADIEIGRHGAWNPMWVGGLSSAPVVLIGVFGVFVGRTRRST